MRDFVVHLIVRSELRAIFVHKTCVDRIPSKSHGIIPAPTNALNVAEVQVSGSSLITKGRETCASSHFSP